MSFAKGLIRTVDGLLKRFKANDRPLYKRVIVRTGGDQLIGRPGTVTYTDTLIELPPSMELVTAASKLSMVLTGSGSLAEVGDYVLTMSPNCMTKAELNNANTLLVLKGSDGSVEDLQIISVDPSMVGGEDVAFEVTVRSKKR